MKKSVIIPIETYKCLRGHLNSALELLQELESEFGGLPAPKLSAKQIKEQKKQYYRDLIDRKQWK